MRSQVVALLALVLTASAASAATLDGITNIYIDADIRSRITVTKILGEELPGIRIVSAPHRAEVILALRGTFALTSPAIYPTVAQDQPVMILKENMVPFTIDPGTAIACSTDGSDALVIRRGVTSPFFAEQSARAFVEAYRAAND